MLEEVAVYCNHLWTNGRINLMQRSVTEWKTRLRYELETSLDETLLNLCQCHGPPLIYDW